MKKIVALGCAAALIGGIAFADEPASNPSVISFTGNASVEWGVDLDAGQTGFKNDTWTEIKLRLFGAGNKVTTGEDVWAELKIKTDPEWGVAGDEGWASNGNTCKPAKAVVDTAKLHFGDFYIGIQSGDTQTGEYKFDGAIRSADNNNAKWLTNVGPDGYTQGIVAGYGNNNFGIDVDFRSNPEGDTRYSSNYAIAAEAKLKDSNELVEGLFVDLGGSVNLSKEKYVSTKYYVDPADTDTFVANEAVKTELAAIADYMSVDMFDLPTGSSITGTVDKYNKIGYSFNAGYKLKIDDKNWLKPAVGLTGTYEMASGDWTVAIPTYGTSKGTYKGSVNSNKLVAGVMFGWGSADGDAGLYYFDGDPTKKACPGVSVVAWIPLADKSSITISGEGTSETGSETSYDKVKVLFTPTLCTKGELVEGLSAAVYSEMAILRSDDKDVSGKDAVSYTNAKDKNDTFALALAGAVKYDIKADEIIVTPQVGFRYVNTAYADNGINGYDPLSTNKFFDGLGIQKKADSGERAALDVYDDGFFNLKAGVNVSGLINNTSFYGVYQSANLLNKTDYSVYKASYDVEKDAKFYNVKLGTFNVGCKISF